MSATNVCALCGEPMPAGEEMFNYHGYSGPCPKAPLPKPSTPPPADPVGEAVRVEVAEMHASWKANGSDTRSTLDMMTECAMLGIAAALARPSDTRRLDWLSTGGSLGSSDVPYNKAWRLWDGRPENFRAAIDAAINAGAGQ